MSTQLRRIQMTFVYVKDQAGGACPATLTKSSLLNGASSNREIIGVISGEYLVRGKVGSAETVITISASRLGL
jgi:hypothetical protein